MKKSLLSLFMLLCTVAITQAQTTYVDFETNTNPIGFDFGGNGHSFGEDNPNATGNTSAKVGLVTTGAETWAGIAMPVGGTIGFSATETTITMDVLSDVTGTVVIKLENSANTAQFTEVQMEYTTANDWQTITYDYGDTLEAGIYNQMVLFFNFGTADATTWYFDNIVGPTATFGSDVTVNFNIEDKLEYAQTSVELKLDDTDVPLTKDGILYTAEKVLAPYTISAGGGEYEAIIIVDGEELDTATISVTGGAATMDWNYIILVEEPEDGTAKAISVGDTPPTIDGTIDDIWSNAKVHPLQQRTWWGSATGLYSYYKIMWDIDNVYVLNYIDDATPKNDGDPVYENDNVELFFDMNQSATDSYDANDWQIRAVRGLTTWTGSANTEAADWSSAERAQVTGDNGYVVEWAIPWTSLSSAFLPLVGTEFNFDVVLADVADAAGRDYIISWATTADQNYNNTSLFGTVTLSDLTSEVTGLRQLEMVNFSVYPNPATDVVHINAETNIAEINLIDVTGRTINSAFGVQAKTASVNVSDVPAGIYLIQVIDTERNASAQKINIH